MLGAAVALGIAGPRVLAHSGEGLLLHPRGGYWYLPGMPFLGFAARAADGYEIVRATFRELRPLPDAIAAVERQLAAQGRPIGALCGLEVRSERQVGLEAFGAFNRTYLELADRAGLVVDGRVPLTRTNVTAAGVREHCVHAFSYTVPVADKAVQRAPTFVVSAIPEVRNITTQPEFVAAGDTSPDGLREKTAFVLATLADVLTTIGVRWTDVTGVQLYSIHDLHPLLDDLILPQLGESARRGIEWHHAYPPVVGNELEIGVRGTRVEWQAVA